MVCIAKLTFPQLSTGPESDRVTQIDFFDHPMKIPQDKNNTVCLPCGLQTHVFLLQLVSSWQDKRHDTFFTSMINVSVAKTRLMSLIFVAVLVSTNMKPKRQNMQLLVHQTRSS